MMKNRLFFIFAISFILACNGNQEVETGTEPYQIEKKYTSGPLTLYLKVDKEKITIADKINLVIEAIIQKDYEVELPAFGEKLEEFSIIDFEYPPAELLGQTGIKSSIHYILEPFLSGEYKIPSMTIHFWATEEGKQEAHELITDELAIQVESLLPEDYEKLELKDITGPMEPTPPDLSWIIYLSIGLVLTGGIITALVLLLKNRQKTKREYLEIYAHELAYNELRKLVALDLIQKGEYKLFYYKISDILRHYIENRFGLHAPEQTTEEFLQNLKNSRHYTQFSRQQKTSLQKFLEHCDLVKFATLQPSTNQIQGTFNTCKQFIAHTEDENVKVTLTPDKDSL